MTARDITSWLAALERVRAQLETALSTDSDWRALGPATPPASRPAHERRLAGNPVYRAWELLNRAIDEMHAECGMGDARGVASGDDRAAELQTGRRRLGLRDVLESIRSGAALDGSEAPIAAPGREPTTPETQVGPPSASIGIGSPSLARADVEEATVSFVFREPAPPPAAAPGDEKRPPAHREAALPGPEVPAAVGDSGTEDEAEVTIVSRPR